MPDRFGIPADIAARTVRQPPATHAILPDDRWQAAEGAERLPAIPVALHTVGGFQQGRSGLA